VLFERTGPRIKYVQHQVQVPTGPDPLVCSSFQSVYLPRSMYNLTVRPDLATQVKP
jgi:hypothetical protein